MQVKVNYHSNGQILYIHLLNDQGQKHAKGCPALQAWHENGQERYRAYYINGQRHNTEGPAIQWWYRSGREEKRVYYINGQSLTKELWEKLCK